ncbi:MAG: toprim domain-containing protein [Chloroflexota bacterium]
MATYAIETLKNNSDLRDYVRQHWGEPKRSTRNYDQYFARWRDDGDSPSFTVYTHGFKDYGGEGLSGSILDFVMYERQCTFKEACEHIHEWLGGSIYNSFVRGRALKRQSKPVAELPSVQWQNIIQQQVEQAHEHLLRQPAILDYLIKARGLSLATIRHAKLGWNPKRHQVRIDGERISITPGILIPWYHGKMLAAVRIRLPVGSFSQFMGESFAHEYSYFDGFSKYISVRGSKLSTGFYYANPIGDAQTTLITEGEFDALLTAQHLATKQLPWQVVTRGSASNYGNLPTNIQNNLQTCQRVYSLLDQDEAGQNATRLLDQQFKNHRSLALPMGQDVTDYLVNDGGDIALLLTQTLARRNQEGQPLVIKPHITPDPCFDQRGLPDSFIAGFTLALGGRSAIGLIAHHLMRAAACGDIVTTTDASDKGCTQKDLLAHLPIARSTFVKALPILQEIGIVHLLEANELVSSTSLQSDDKTSDRSHQGGRPPKYYQISLDRIDIATYLVEAIQARLIEDTFRDIPVVPSELLAIQADLDMTTFSAWADLHRDLLASDSIDERWQQVENEIKGDRHWQGWRALLYEPQYDQFAFWSEEQLEDHTPHRLSEWREQLMMQRVQQNPTRFNRDWRRILGALSPQTVHNVRHRLGLISDSNYATSDPIVLKQEVCASHERTIVAITHALRNSGTRLRGRVIRAECQVESFSKPVHYGFLGTESTRLIRLMAQHRLELQSITFVVQTASTYRLPTEEDLQAQLDQAEEPAIDDTTADDVDGMMSPDEAETVNHSKVRLHKDSTIIRNSLPLEEVDRQWLQQNLRLQYYLVVGWMPPDDWHTRQIIHAMIAHYQVMVPAIRAQQRAKAHAYYRQVFGQEHLM